MTAVAPQGPSATKQKEGQAQPWVRGLSHVHPSGPVLAGLLDLAPCNRAAPSAHRRAPRRAAKTKTCGPPSGWDGGVGWGRPAQPPAARDSQASVRPSRSQAQVRVGQWLCLWDRRGGSSRGAGSWTRLGVLCSLLQLSGTSPCTRMHITSVNSRPQGQLCRCSRRPTAGVTTPLAAESPGVQAGDGQARQRALLLAASCPQATPCSQEPRGDRPRREHRLGQGSGHATHTQLRSHLQQATRQADAEGRPGHPGSWEVDEVPAACVSASGTSKDGPSTMARPRV